MTSEAPKAAKIDVTGYSPDLFGTAQQLVIRCEIVEQPPEGPRRSGKYIHLGLTAGDAMRLLALLQGAQKKWGLPLEPHPATEIDVPPKEDRH